MKRELQVVFVRELTSRVADSVITQIIEGKVPEDWDVHELRQLLADRFQASAAISDAMRNKRRKRYRDYLNTCIVNNLV